MSLIHPMTLGFEQIKGLLHDVVALSQMSQKMVSLSQQLNEGNWMLNSVPSPSTLSTASVPHALW